MCALCREDPGKIQKAEGVIRKQGQEIRFRTLSNAGGNIDSQENRVKSNVC